MLARLAVGTKLVGLRRLLASGRPGFDGCYRLATSGVNALEFFDRLPGPGEYAVKILPYQSNAIAQMAIGGSEVISGEFTGCVMTTFRNGQGLFAGHVDTNSETSQRAEWGRRKELPGIQVVSEYDTTGQLQPSHGAGAVILCVADSQGAITHYHVRGEAYQYGHNQPAGAPFANYKNDTLYTIIPE